MMHCLTPNFPPSDLLQFSKNQVAHVPFGEGRGTGCQLHVIECMWWWLMGEDDMWEYWNMAHHGTLGSCLICVAVLCEPLIMVHL